MEKNKHIWIAVLTAMTLILIFLLALLFGIKIGQKNARATVIQIHTASSLVPEGKEAPQETPQNAEEPVSVPETDSRTWHVIE